MARRKEGASDLPWRTTLRLTEETGKEIDRIAVRDAIPSATVCRIIIMEHMERLTRERERQS